MGKNSGRTRTIKGAELPTPKYAKNVRDLVTVKDPRVYNEFKKAMSRFHATLGIRQRTIKLADFQGRYRNSYGLHQTRAGKSEFVLLNAKYFDKDFKTIERDYRKSNYGANPWINITAKPVQHTLIHELGHALWNNHLTSKKAQNAGKEIRQLFREWKKDTTKVGYGRYGASNASEFWAEAVAKTVRGEQDKYTKEIKRIVRKYRL